MKSYYFIVNPQAGSGRGKKVWHKIKKTLLEKQVQFKIYFTEFRGHGKELANRIGKENKDTEIEAVIAVGGDGTIHEVINGLIPFSSIKVGYIPAGSGNDFARGFSIPQHPIKALEQILNADEIHEQYDFGYYQFGEEKNMFASSVGLGFDAMVAEITNQSSYKKVLNKVGLGFLAYVISVLRLLFFFKPFCVHLFVDQKKYYFQNVWLVAISNIPFYGGGMKINPEASPQDGWLNICVVHHLSRWKLLLFFLTVFWGKHTRLKEVLLLKGKEIALDTSYPIPFHTDGEVNGTAPIKITVEKKAREIM